MGVYHQIKDKFIMQNARADWASYRAQLTDLILQMYPETVMIVGAGRCNDIDLGKLVGAGVGGDNDIDRGGLASTGAGRCDDIDPGRRMGEGVRRVVLLDVDTDGMQEAAASLPEEQRSKLELRTSSLTGISEDDMEAFCDRMLSYVRSAGRDLSVNSVRGELMSSMDMMESKLDSEQKGRLDSELNREWDHEKESRGNSEREGEQESRQESKQESKRESKQESKQEDNLEREQKSKPADGVPVSKASVPESRQDIVICCGVHSQLFSTLSFFVRSLIHSLHDILPGVDVLEGEASERIRRMNDQVIPGINRALYNAAGKCVIFGNEFMPEHPVEGAHQCILDVREHYRPEEAHLTWEFNKAEGISYDMLIQICRV